MLHGFVVTLKSPPPHLVPLMVHVDPGRLLLCLITESTDTVSDLSPCSHLLLLFFFFKTIFINFDLVCFSEPCLLSLISLLSFPALLSLLSACPGTQREKGGLGAVCLKPSRFNLLRPSTVKKKKDCICYLSFSFPSHFLNPAPFSREKWLPSLFCFSSLNQGNDRKLENVAVIFVLFFFSSLGFFCLFLSED